MTLESAYYQRQIKVYARSASSNTDELYFHYPISEVALLNFKQLQLFEPPFLYYYCGLKYEVHIHIIPMLITITFQT